MQWRGLDEMLKSHVNTFHMFSSQTLKEPAGPESGTLTGHVMNSLYSGEINKCLFFF